MSANQAASTLFNQSNKQPLAERLRPKNLDEVVGQQHLVGEGKVLRKSIESGVVHSMLFWGPPGVVKRHLPA